MVVRLTLLVLVCVAAQNGMRQRIALACAFPAAIDKRMAVLSCGDAIQHNGEVAAGGVFHANGDIQRAGCQAMVLVFHRTRAHGNVAQQIVQVLIVVAVQHFVGADESGFGDGAHVQIADGHNAFEHVGLGLGVGLVQHAFVAQARGARFVCVDARNEVDLVGHFFLKLCQAAQVIKHAVFAVGRARPNDKQQAVVVAGEDVGDFFAASCEYLVDQGRCGLQLFQLRGDGQFTSEVGIHMFLL